LVTVVDQLTVDALELTQPLAGFPDRLPDALGECLVTVVDQLTVDALELTQPLAGFPDRLPDALGDVAARLVTVAAQFGVNAVNRPFQLPDFLRLIVDVLYVAPDFRLAPAAREASKFLPHSF